MRVSVSGLYCSVITRRTAAMFGSIIHDNLGHVADARRNQAFAVGRHDLMRYARCADLFPLKELPFLC